jgi:hypothetical protein
MQRNKMQIDQEDGIIQFLKYGENIDSFIRLEEKISEVEKICGYIGSKNGNNECGYYYCGNGLRIGYIDEYINEIAINFYQEKRVRYPLTLQLVFNLNSISKKTEIYQLLKLLNLNNIKWKCFDEKSKEMFSIITEGYVMIMFSLENGKIHSMIYSQISLSIGNNLFSV